MQHQPSIQNKPLKCDGLSDSGWSDPVRLVYIAAGVCFRMGRIALVMYGRAVCACHLHESCFYRTGIHQGKLQKLLQASVLLKRSFVDFYVVLCTLDVVLATYRKASLGGCRTGRAVKVSHGKYLQHWQRNCSFFLLRIRRLLETGTCPGSEMTALEITTKVSIHPVPRWMWWYGVTAVEQGPQIFPAQSTLTAVLSSRFLFLCLTPSCQRGTSLQTMSISIWHLGHGG